MPEGNGTGRATIAQVYELLAPLDARLRRTEIMGAVLTVAILSPKVGGPSPSNAISAIMSLL